MKSLLREMFWYKTGIILDEFGIICDGIYIFFLFIYKKFIYNIYLRRFNILRQSSRRHTMHDHYEEHLSFSFRSRRLEYFHWRP